jgi:hypothetical protein
VRSLLDGLSEDDDVAMLQSRLRALPPTLEEYFELMLRSIDPVYKRHTARALLIACNAMQPLPTIAYCHLQEEMSSPGYAIRAPIESLTTKQVRSSQQRARSWIDKWCRDLLEVTDSGGSMAHRVEFLHRTVKDFLMNEDTQQWFLRNSGIDFSPQLSLCRTYLAQAKGLSDACSASEFIHIAGLLMFHAKEYEVSLHRTPYATIEELNRVGNVVAAPFSTSHCHWSTACDWEDSERPDMCESNFLAYAIEFDLQLYWKKHCKSHRTKSKSHTDRHSSTMRSNHRCGTWFSALHADLYVRLSRCSILSHPLKVKATMQTQAVPAS